MEWDKMSEGDKERIEDIYDIRDIFELTPTPESNVALRAHNCIFKRTSMGFLVGIKVVADKLNPGKFNAFVPINDNQTFRFLVKLKDANFINYTALPLGGISNKMFKFSNNPNNISDTFPSLSAIPPVFKMDHLYMPGDMLSNDSANQTKLYTALLKTSNNPALSEDWLTENIDVDTPMIYANINDSYPVANGFLIYTMKVKNAKPIATMKNSSGFAIQPKMEVLPGDFYALQVDLLKYPQGIYSIHIDSDDPTYHDDLTFYLLHGNETPFALIEIKVKSKQPSYDLFNQGNLLSPTFEIRFRNRRTHWKYFGKQFESPYILDEPLPLTRYGNIEITIPPKPGETKTTVLPNPSVSSIKAEAFINTEEKKYYSEIHIH
jgi:hypothetical protein